MVRDLTMEFFRNNQKIIIGVIAISFVLWTVGPILLAVMSYVQK